MSGLKTMWAARPSSSRDEPLTEQEKWNNIAWNLPAGQVLRAKIEALVAELAVEQASLQDVVRTRDETRQTHDRNAAVAESAQASLQRLAPRKGEMDAALGDVRQKLEAIQQELRKLTKADLDQLRRMPDPPVPIRRTMEMVHLLLNASTVSVTQKLDYERQCRRTLGRSDLISSILNYDSAQLAQQPLVAQYVRDNYLSPKEHKKKSTEGTRPAASAANSPTCPVEIRAGRSPTSGGGGSDTSPTDANSHASFAAGFASAGGFGGGGSIGAFFGAGESVQQEGAQRSPSAASSGSTAAASSRSALIVACMQIDSCTHPAVCTCIPSDLSTLACSQAHRRTMNHSQTRALTHPRLPRSSGSPATRVSSSGGVQALARVASGGSAAGSSTSAGALSRRSSSSSATSPASPSAGKTGVGGAALAVAAAGRMGSVARKEAKTRSLEDDALTEEVVKYASKASAQLFKWCVCQLDLADVLRAFAPLLQEAAALDTRLAETTQEGDAAERQRSTAAKELVTLEARCCAQEAKVEELLRRLRALQAEGEALEAKAARMAQDEQQAARQAQGRARGRQQAAEAEAAAAAAAPRCVHCRRQIGKDEPAYARSEGMLHAACQPAFDDVDDPEPAAPAVEITDVRVSVCERIEFASGSEDIPPIFMSAVDGVMRAIADNPDVKIQVEGHCDKGESPELAQARAQAVMRSLLSRGAKASQLRADGFGCACAAGTPVAGTGGRAARAARAAGEAAKGHNRRVTFSVIQEIKIDGSIQFGAMSASIGAASGPLLRQVIKVLEGRPHLHVMVEGHTCSAPSWGVSNLELSQQRAAAVVEHLVRAGIRAERLSSKGWGEQLPAFPHAHKARNRRVEFHIQARACEQGLRQLVASEAKRRKLRDDPAAVKGFRDLAGARNGGGADALVRCAAADVLLALAVEWRIHRLLLLAVRKGRFSPKFPGQSCALALLDDDCCRLVMRHFFMS